MIRWPSNGKRSADPPSQPRASLAMGPALFASLSPTNSAVRLTSRLLPRESGAGWKFQLTASAAGVGQILVQRFHLKPQGHDIRSRPSPHCKADQHRVAWALGLMALQQPRVCSDKATSRSTFLAICCTRPEEMRKSLAISHSRLPLCAVGRSGRFDLCGSCSSKKRYHAVKRNLEPSAAGL
jgi:hypothetical protein